MTDCTLTEFLKSIIILIPNDICKVDDHVFIHMYKEELHSTDIHV